MSDLTIDIGSTATSSTKYSFHTQPQQTSYSTWVKAGLVFGTTTGAFLLAKSTGALSWMVGLFGNTQQEPDITGALQTFDGDHQAALTVPGVAQDFGRHSVVAGAGARADVAAVADDVGKIQGLGAVEFAEQALPEVQTKRDVQAIPTDGLVAWYPFNGDANDASGNGHHGTVYGATLTTDRFGNAGKAYSFSGYFTNNVGSYIKGSSTTFPTDQRTVSCWFKAQKTNLGGASLFSYGGGDSIASWFMATIYNSANGNGYMIAGPYARNIIEHYNFINESLWYHFVGVMDVATSYIYLDGELKATENYVHNTYVNNKEFAIGTWTSYETGLASEYPNTASQAHPFKGVIDDIRIYNRALTSTEITALYQESTNTAPTLVNKTITIQEGQTIDITTSMLGATDPESGPSDITFNISTIQNGYFQFASDPGNSITTFTQQQIMDNAVQFVHDGSETAPTFTVTVSDGTTTTTAVAATINFTRINDVPSLTIGNIRVALNGNILLTTVMLNAQDPDDTATVLHFDVTNMQYGRIELTTNPGVAIYTFTKQQLINNQVRLVSTDVTNLPEFDIVVSDDAPSSSQLLHVQASILQAPIIINHSLSVSEGATVGITTSMLSVQSTVTADQLTFNCINMQHGTFELTTNPNVAVTSFTYQQLMAGQVQFKHDDGEIAPAFDFSVTDGTMTSSIQTAVITFTKVNDAPLVNVPIGEQKVKIDEQFSFAVPADTFVDPDGDVLTLTAKTSAGTSLPNWLSFDAQTRYFSGTPIAAEQTRISLIARDPASAEARTDFNLVVVDKDVPSGTSSTATIAGVAGGVATVGLAVGFFKLWDVKSRQTRPFAAALRKELKLSCIDNFSYNATNVVAKTLPVYNRGKEFAELADRLESKLNARDLETISRKQANAAAKLVAAVIRDQKNIELSKLRETIAGGCCSCAPWPCGGTDPEAFLNRLKDDALMDTLVAKVIAKHSSQLDVEDGTPRASTSPSSSVYRP